MGEKQAITASGYNYIESPSTQETEPNSQTVITVYDIDKTLLGSKMLYDCFVQSQAFIHNSIIKYIAQKDNYRIIPTILTTRPASAFLKEGKLPIRFFKRLCGYNHVGNGEIEEEQIRIIGCENGTVRLIRNSPSKVNRVDTQLENKEWRESWEETDDDKGWIIQVDPRYDSYVNNELQELE